MPGTWLREDQAALAVQKILDGAASAFVELGVSGAGMGEIARYAGCSRGTLYRYFKNRHELHLAFVQDRAKRLVAELQSELEELDDPAERLCEYILRSAAKVRADPAMAAWFEGSQSGLTARMSRSAEVIDTLSQTFVSKLGRGTNARQSEGDLLARWMVRIIVSLLMMPGETEAEERTLVERFVVPAILSKGDPAQARRSR